MARSIAGLKHRRLNQWKYEISRETAVPYRDTEHYMSSLERNARSRVRVPKSLI